MTVLLVVRPIGMREGLTGGLQGSQGLTDSPSFVVIPSTIIYSDKNM